MTEKVERALERFVEYHSPVRDVTTLLILVGDKQLFRPPMMPGDEPTWIEVLAVFLVRNRHLSPAEVMQQVMDKPPSEAK